MRTSRHLMLHCIRPSSYNAIGALILVLIGLQTFSPNLRAQAQDVPADPLPDLPSDEPPAIVDSAAVEAIRATNPSTPRELMRAVDLLVRLDRPDLAREYLSRLIGSALDADALSDLHKQFGTATMLRLTKPDLAPEGASFARSVLDAAKLVSQDPQRIADDVAQLGSPQRETQLRAARRLLRSGAYAVPALVTAISTQEDAQITNRARAVLARLGNESVAPLVAYLSSADPQLRQTAISALGRSRSRAALPFLTYPFLADSGEWQAAADAFESLIGSVPQSSEARELLEQSAERAYDGLIAQKADLDGTVLSWTWDESQKSAVPYRLFQPDAAALQASRLYTNLYQLDPRIESNLVRSLISRLNVDQAMSLDNALRRGEGTVHDDAVLAGRMTVERVLSESLSDEHWIAAVAAAGLLGELGDRDALKGRSGNVAPLVLALTDPNRRVRFAAAQAIMKLQPRGTFPGSSRLPQAIGYFAGSTGQRQILILHPSRQHGRNLGGLANQAGFSSEVVTEPSELVQRAIDSPDWELIMISDAVRGQSLWSLIAELRSDPKSAEIPIVLLGFRSDSMIPLDLIADSHGRTIAFPEPIESELFGQIVSDGLQLAGRQAVAAERRLEQAAIALNWLTQLSAQDPNRFSTLLRQQEQVLAALYTPELAELATVLTAQLPTSEAQLALTDLASLNTMPIEQRRSAAKAFDQSVQANGVLLNRTEIQQQYDRYNDSKELDADTQSVLGTLLDSIEGPGSPGDSS